MISVNGSGEHKSFLIKALSAYVKHFKKKGSFVKNASILIGSAGLGQIIGILSAPILTRLFDPSDYGVFAVYSSTLGIIGSIVTLRYRMAIPLCEDNVGAKDTIVVSILASFIVSVVTGLYLSYFGSETATKLNSSGITPYLWFVPVGLFATGVFQTLEFYVIRLKSFPAIAKSKLMESGFATASKIGFGFMKIGSPGLMIGDLLGRISGALVLLIHTLMIEKGFLKSLRLGGIKDIVTKYWRFPFLSAPSTLINAATYNMPPLMIAGIFGPVSTGFYSLAQRILILPVTFVGISVGQVYYGEGAKLVSKDIHALKRLYIRTVSVLFLLGLFPIGLLVLFGPFLFSFFFGDNWHQAGVFARILAPGYLVAFCSSTTTNLDLLERPDLSLYWTTGYFVLTISGFYAAKRWSFSPENTLIIYSAIMFLAYITLFILNLFAIKMKAKKVTAHLID